jgi:hypothetical protein
MKYWLMTIYIYLAVVCYHVPHRLFLLCVRKQPEPKVNMLMVKQIQKYEVLLKRYKKDV